MGNTLKGLKRAGLIALTLVAVTCVTLPIQARDIMFTTSEKDGSKIWEGGGTIDLKDQ